MRTLTGILTALSIPLMIINMLGSIVAGIWLAIIGEWSLIVLGIIAFLFSSTLLSFALIPSFLLGAPAVYCAEKENTFGMVFFVAISNLYTIVLITVWCCGILFLFVKNATNASIIPLLIWSYGVATGPWAYMASKDQGPKGEGFGSTLATFLAKLAYLVIMIHVIFTSITLLDAIKIFMSFMLVGLIIQIVLAVIIQKEEKIFTKGSYKLHNDFSEDIDIDEL